MGAVLSDLKTALCMAAELCLRLLIHPRMRAHCLGLLGARIGRNVRIYECRFINLRNGFSNLRIGDDVHVGTDCLIDLQGPVHIGSGTVLAPRVTLMSHSDPGSAHGSSLCARWPAEALGVVIGKGCWIGAGTTILSAAVVEDGVVVGAAALVRGVLKAGTLCAGVPARPIGRI